MADNDITIAGNATREPELRFTQGGKAVCSVSVAVNRRYQQNGEWKDAETEFFDCQVWEQLAENVAASVHKGDRLMVKGRLQTRKYEAKDGTQRTAVEIIVDEIGLSMKFARLSAERVRRDQQGGGSPDRGPVGEPAYSGGHSADPVYANEEPF